MSTQRSIARRDVLALLCASGVMSGGLVRAAESGVAPGASMLAQGIDPSAIRALGAQYRKDHPDDADSQIISKLLRNRSLTPEKISTRLRSMVNDDYRRDRTVELSGWHLSRTEARVFTALSDYLS
jgi:hypothetical protein